MEHSGRHQAMRVVILILITPIVFIAVVIAVSTVKDTVKDTRDDGGQRAGIAASRARLTDIGVALQAYADDHDGSFPDSSDVLRNRLRQWMPVAHPIKAPHPGSKAYCYIAGYGTNAPHDTIVMYEYPWTWHTDGLHVLFADGRVEWIDSLTILQYFESTTLPGGLEHPPHRDP